MKMKAFKLLVALALPVLFVITVFNIMPAPLAVLSLIVLGVVAYKIVRGYLRGAKMSKNI